VFDSGQGNSAHPGRSARFELRVQLLWQLTHGFHQLRPNGPRGCPYAPRDW